MGPVEVRPVLSTFLCVDSGCAFLANAGVGPRLVSQCSERKRLLPVLSGHTGTCAEGRVRVSSRRSAISCVDLGKRQHPATKRHSRSSCKRPGYGYARLNCCTGNSLMGIPPALTMQTDPMCRWLTVTPPCAPLASHSVAGCQVVGHYPWPRNPLQTVHR